MATSSDDSSLSFLTQLLPHLDRHLIYPLLEHESNAEDVPTEKYNDLRLAIFNLLKNTNMTDFVADLYKDTHNGQSPPAEFEKKRSSVVTTLQKYEEDASHILDVLEDDSITNQLRSDKIANLKFLADERQVTQAEVDLLYTYGRFRYECGQYQEASDLLYKFRILSADGDKVSKATWGKLVCDILSEDYEQAVEEIDTLSKEIETRLFNNPRAQLTAREALIHYALFPFFNHEAARDKLTDMYFSPPFISTIQTTCPWILRYLTTAVITNRSRLSNSHNYQRQLKDLTRVVKQEIYEYTDPVTEFIRALYVDFDFESAQAQLGKAEKVLEHDFFLGSSTDSFIEAARHLISESYCKIHQRIDINDLSTRLNLSNTEEGEKWIVNLIRDTKLDAKIDYKAGTVVMNHPSTSVYQSVIERTKGSFFRTSVLSGAVAR